MIPWTFCVKILSPQPSGNEFVWYTAADCFDRHVFISSLCIMIYTSRSQTYWDKRIYLKISQTETNKKSYTSCPNFSELLKSFYLKKREYKVNCIWWIRQELPGPSGSSMILKRQTINNNSRSFGVLIRSLNVID